MKKLLAMTLALVMVFALCSGGMAYAANTTITLMASQDWIEDAEQDLGAAFEEETGIHVDYQIIPSDQYYDVLMTRLNSGEGWCMLRHDLL